MFKIFKNKKGFSMVELIVVIAILGVISAIAVPVVLNNLADSKIKADVATAQAISNAVKTAIASANSDTKTGNDIADGDTLASDNLLAELKKSFPDIETKKPQSATAGTFSVEITTVDPPAWAVSFEDGKGDSHSIDQDGKEAEEQ